jgi:hypothetical protein
MSLPPEFPRVLLDADRGAAGGSVDHDSSKEDALRLTRLELAYPALGLAQILMAEGATVEDAYTEAFQSLSPGERGNFPRTKERNSTSKES